MYRTFNCKLDFIFLKSLCNVSKQVFAINIWLPCEKFYTEEDFNRNVYRQQLCFYIIIIIIIELSRTNKNVISFSGNVFLILVTASLLNF